jgi:drug/metabolite transporter (DMT)-like permease
VVGGSTPWPVRFVLLALFWGSTFLFIKIGDEALAPLQVSFGRLIVGTSTLLAILAAGHESLPRGRRIWVHLAIAAILLNVAPFTLFAYGEQHVSSVRAGIWNATVPLFTLPLAILWLADERATARRLAGLAVGFVGVLIVLGVWRGLGATSLEGNLLCLGAAASYGLGFPYARKYLARRPEGPLALATAQLICATVELAVLTAVFAHAPHGVAAKHVLGVVAPGALGVLALGEPLTWYEPLGAAIIIAGAVLASYSLSSIGKPQLQSGRPVRAGRHSRAAPITSARDDISANGDGASAARWARPPAYRSTKYAPLPCPLENQRLVTVFLRV